MSILNVQFASKDAQAPPSAALKFNGPAIPVLVGLAPVAQENGTATFSGEQMSALIDTGAYTSCIDDALAQKIKLTPIDKQEVSGATGKEERLVYLGMVYVPDLQAYSKGRFVGVDLAGPHPVLLGRDFLEGCILIYNGTSGSFSIMR